MKHCRRFLTLVLALAMAAALAVPGYALGSFDDITNETDAVNADVLRFMGVVDGAGGNRFLPADKLSRAQFCALVINIMGRKGEVAGQMNRTIFIDVPSTHWARGYVNLAASTVISEGGARLITGTGNGRFLPDADITYGQAVTILVRVLGYGDAQVGNIWPRDYVNKAQELGLSRSLTLTADQAITRAQAAQLFINMLTCNIAAGSPYYATMGTVTRDVILFSVDAELNGVKGAVQTSKGIYLPANDAALPATLQGRRGIQVINGEGRIAAFIPDGSVPVTVTLAEKASETSFRGENGTRYTIAKDVPVYDGKWDPSKYETAYDRMVAGTKVTVYSAGGQITALCYTDISNAAPTFTGDAVIVSGKASEAMFFQLTGGAQGYRIVKDGSQIAMGDIQPNDVVTYDEKQNVLFVSDLRFTALYEGATPNVRAPERLTVLGIKDGLEILPCALDSILKFKVNDTFTLLLTADGKVAGAVAPSTQNRSTAVGLVSGGTVEIPLPAGGSLTCGPVVNGADLNGQLVTVTSSSRNGVNVTRLTSRSIPGDFNVKSMTLGQYPVAAGAKICERAGSTGPLQELDLERLDMDIVPAAQVAVYGLNSSNMVDVLVLSDVTGDTYTYGLLTAGSKEVPSSGELQASNRTVQVWNSTSKAPVLEYICPLAFPENSFGGVSQGNDKIGGTWRAGAVIQLTAVTNVTTENFFKVADQWYVNAGGRVYPVAEKVQCYNSATKEWFTGNDTLAQARAFALTMTVYVDPIGGWVRVVAAQ